MTVLDPRDVVLAALLLGACWTDVRTQKIKNVLTFPVMVTGILMAPLFAEHWYLGLAGWGADFLAALPAFVMGQTLRAGDVKMLAAAGALVGPEIAVHAVLFSFVLLIPVGLLVLTVRGRLGNLKKVWIDKDHSDLTWVAHAPVISAGVLLARMQPWPNLWGATE